LSHPCPRLGREMYTIKHAAEMVGIPVATLRAWQRRYRVVNPERSNAGYRLYGDEDIAVLRRMQALVTSGWSPKEASKATASGEARVATTPAPRPDEPPVSGSASREGKAAPDLVEAAAALDPFAVSRMLDEHFATSSFEQIVDSWLLPQLERLGRAWADNRVTVAGEHMVAAAVQRRLSAAFDAAGQDSRRACFLLTGLPSGSRHELGILSFATAARRQGLAVLHLGTDLPLADWLSAVERQQPDAVVLAVPTPSDVASAAELVQRLSARQTLVALGGQYQEAVVEATDGWGGRPAVALGHSIARAAAELRERLVPAVT
jgi:DNA-binding transcriptional MerR regulator/methanogenic corrinoid protein MtbC1